MKLLATFVFSTLFFIIISCGTTLKQSARDSNHYNIELKLSPQNQTIDIKGKLFYISTEVLSDTAVFYLHRQFEITFISGKDVEGFEFFKDIKSGVSYMPDARILLVKFNRTLEKGEIVEIDFEYSGKITDWPNWSANVITKEWTEIGLYLPWFPYNSKHGVFTFDLNVECDDGYEVRSYGDFTKVGNKWQFSVDQPVRDIAVFAAKEIKSKEVKDDNYSLRVYYVDVHDTTAEKIVKDLGWTMSTLNNWFGKTKRKDISLVQSLREFGGGYSRLGVMSMTGLHDSTYAEDYEGYMRYLVHEASHLWWWQAPIDWNDWLNEGFAEYFAHLALKEKFGEEVFDKRLAEKEKELKQIPPIWRFNRTVLTTDKDYNIVERNLYDKAPLLLKELDEKIGHKRFIRLCREMLDNDIASTKIFLSLLEKSEGNEIAYWFEEQLKTR